MHLAAGGGHGSEEGQVTAPLAMREWAVKLEAKPKYVVSTTRSDFGWNSGSLAQRRSRRPEEGIHAVPVLGSAPQLADLQRYVAELEQEPGFAEQGVIEKCLLLGEEIGELFKAVRTCEGLKVDTPGGEVSDELADVLIYLCAIANRMDIDLEAAFRAKEAKNHRRVWR